MSFFDATSVPANTQAEINARATSAGVLWGSKRAPWFHLLSMCTKCSTPIISTNTWGYQLNYQRPKVTVTQIQVKKQGELGTTRRAIVSMTAFTDADLLTLQQCFFIPGMSVRLQWGWSTGAAFGAPPSPILTTDISDNQANCKIRAQAATSPIYDGLQGIVANFSYGVNNENNWDCTLEVIAPANLMLDSQVGYSCCNNCKTTLSEPGFWASLRSSTIVTAILGSSDPTPDQFEKNKGALYGALLKMSDNDDPDVQKTNITSLVSKIKGLGYTDAYGAIIQYEGADRSADGKSDDQSMWSFGNYDTDETYITWHMLEGMVSLFAFPSQGGKPSLGQIKTKDPVEVRYPQSGDYWPESADPRICLLPGSNAYTGGGGLSSKIYEADLTAPGTRTWQADTAPSAVSGYTVDWKRILINTTFLLLELDATIEANGTVETFLRNVMRKVNEAIGSVASLDIVSADENCTQYDTENVPSLSIVELKSSKPASPYQIPGLPQSTSLRDLKLDLKMTEAMKTQALYSNADKGQGSGNGGSSDNTCNTTNDPCANYAFEPFGLAKNTTSINAAYPKGDFTDACDTCGGLKDAQDPNKPPVTPSTAFKDYVDKMIDCVNDDTTASVKNAMVKFIRQAVDANKKDVCSSMILPLNFQFTVDGVGGFKWGQSVSCTRIPSSIRPKFDWQITAVEHNVTIQDWTTTVNTVARFKG